jgi:hypothetical protein
MRQVCTEGASDGVQEQLKSLRAELRNTMAACLIALKSATEDDCQPAIHFHVAHHDAQPGDNEGSSPGKDCEYKTDTDSVSGNRLRESKPSVTTSVKDSSVSGGGGGSSSSRGQCKAVQEDQRKGMSRTGRLCSSSEQNCQEPVILGESSQQPVLDEMGHQHQSNQGRSELMAQCYIQENSSPGLERHAVCVSLGNTSYVQAVKDASDGISSRIDSHAQQVSVTTSDALCSGNHDSAQQGKPGDVENTLNKPIFHRHRPTSAGMGSNIEISSIVMLQNHLSNNPDSNSPVQQQSQMQEILPQQLSTTQLRSPGV